MDRAEATGLGVAFAGHGALLALLSLGFAAAKAPQIRNEPIEVSLVEDIGLESTAPTPSAEEPAPLLAEVEGPPEPAPAPVPQPLPQPPVPLPLPQPKVAAPPPPAPSPRAAPRPQPPRPAPPQPKAAQRPAPPKAAQAATRPQQNAAATRPTGRLSGLLTGIGARDTESRATTPPAKSAGPAVEASLVAEVRRQIKPHWQRSIPTGADAEMLRTQITITLSKSGAVTGMRDVSTSGQTASNRPQVALHQERSKRAIALAAPFRLPAEFYENWKELTVTLDQRLSQ